MKKVINPTRLLAGVCLLDLGTTLWVLSFHGGSEGNPLMRGFLSHGVATFVAAKLAFVVIPVAVLVWARRRRPLFVHRASWAGVAAYLVIYCSGSVRANSKEENTALTRFIDSPIVLQVAELRPLTLGVTGDQAAGSRR